MKFLYFLLFLFSFVGTSILAQKQVDTIHYTVAQAEGFYSIQRKFGISREELIFHNPDAKDGLKLGQKLVIPLLKEKEAGTDVVDYIEHTILPKETLYGLSVKYQVTQEAIRKANAGLGVDLRIGELIKIPNVNQIRQGSDLVKVHHVQAKETIYGLCKRYGISQEELLRLNPGLLTEGLKAGSVIRLQEGEAAEGQGRAIKDLPTGGIEHSSSQAKPINKVPPREVSDFFVHRVSKGESLYGLSKYYGVSQLEVRTLNKSVNFDDLGVGDEIYIPKTAANESLMTAPKSFFYYYVPKKIKLNDLAQIFGLDPSAIKAINPGVKRKIKENTLIKIPLQVYVKEEHVVEKRQELTEDVDLTKPELVETDMSHIFKRKRKKLDQIHVALLLPFYAVEDEQTSRQAYTSDLFIEFYAGVKMALDSLRNTGIDVYVHCFDTKHGTSELAYLLDGGVLRKMNLIIGPAYPSQLPMLADYAQKHKIMTVLPFKTTEPVSNNNPYLVELNRCSDFWSEPGNIDWESWLPSGVLYVLSDEKLDSENAAPLDLARLQASIDAYNTEKGENKVRMRSIDINDLSLQGGGQHALFIIPSLNQAVLSSIMPHLHRKVKQANIHARVLGYPEWQSFRSLDMDMLHDLNLTLYTPVFLDYEADHSREFLKNYREKYYTEPKPQYPYFGVYGYDVFNFFVHALDQDGKFFDQFLADFSVSMVASDFELERPQLWSGFINKGFVVIHYTPSFEMKVLN